MAHVQFKQFVPDVQAVSKTTGIPVSVTIAQIILESSNGKYPGNMTSLAYKYKNLFGIKGTGSGGTVNLKTGEVYDGKTVTITAGFKVFTTFQDAIKDHNRILNLTRYRKHTDKATSIEDYCKGVKAGGYATDPHYASKLMTLIKQYNLIQYEVLPRFKNMSLIQVTPTTPPQNNVYKGPSIVEYLRSKGMKYDFTSRRQLATKHGINHYTGTSVQNTKLLKTLRGY